jgi:putative CocE/NonD family hydrolase
VSITSEQEDTASSKSSMTRYRPVGPTPRERYEARYAEEVKSARRITEVGIPMRDGITLAADIYMPDASVLPAPAVICINNGYDKSPLFRPLSPVIGVEGQQSGYGFARESFLFQDHGYIYVNVDERGRGKSEGEHSDVRKAGLPSPYGDGPDAYDVIEWVARQEWCNGMVATTGGSMLGSSQYIAAFERPPHLSCILPIAAGGLWLTEREWENGCYHLYGSVSMAIRTRGRLMHNVALHSTNWKELLAKLPLEAVIEQVNHPVTMEVLRHDRLDDFWKPRMLDGKRREITMPALHIAGWLDHRQTRGMLKGYEWARESPAADQQWLIVGPWNHGDALFHPSHKYPGRDFGRDAAIELDQIKLDWYARWLRGDQESWRDVPKVQLFETGTNVWRSSDNWPLPGHDEVLYFSGAGEGLLSPVLSTVAATRTYRYDPADPLISYDPMDTVMSAPWNPAKYPDGDHQAYQVGRADVLRYTSAPLQAEVATSGWPRLRFFASSDCDDTEFHVRLADVQPDGRAVEIAFGCVRASYRDSLEHPTPLTPGEVHEFNVELTPITHAFVPGHSIRVTITSSDFPAYARSLNRFGSYATLADPRIAQNTIHDGASTPSQVILPVTRGSVSGQ